MSDFDGFDEETFDLMLEHCGKLKLVVEVGCGSGAWTKHLSKVADDFVGIDFSPILLSRK